MGSVIKHLRKTSTSTLLLLFAVMALSNFQVANLHASETQSVMNWFYQMPVNHAFLVFQEKIVMSIQG